MDGPPYPVFPAFGALATGYGEDVPWAVEQIVLPEDTHAAGIGETCRRTMPWLFRDP
ncbi:MAG TPA: hypothetical protein PK743_10715 [Luteimonas sp.]|nr:hypothetical protein [Luteimonas sp.]HRO26432.1 hypothetical protein [Luteimonas sp.]HRP73091.1 hypothetical protein [Luteimonas sp.]